MSCYENDDYSSDIRRLTEQMSILKKKVEKQYEEIEDLKNTLKTKDAEIHDLNRRNVGLQNKLLSRLDELDSMYLIVFHI